MNLLFVVHRDHWETKLERGRFLEFEALSSNHATAMTGPGWPQWFADRPAKANVEASAFGTPDATCFYKLDGVAEPAGIAGFRWLTLAEWRPDRALPEIDLVKPHVVCCRYRQTVSCLRQSRPDLEVVYLPHAADDRYFWPPSDHAMRPIDVLVAGAASPTMYPLRTKMLTACGKLPEMVHVKRWEHPGQTVQHAHRGDHLAEWGSVLRKSTILLTCSARRKLQLAKFVEAMACGAVVVSDIPDCCDHELARAIVPVQDYWSPERIANTVVSTLADQTLLAESRRLGVEYAARHTTETNAARIETVLLKGK